MTVGESQGSEGPHQTRIKYDQAKPSGFDPDIPGGVYLCQVGETVSCGACCGLYNVAELSRNSLHAMLTRRTRRFVGMAGQGRDLDTLLSYRKWVEDSEPQQRPLAEFHHCPYIGLIGPNLSRPGCLLHPLGNNGVDFRGISDYGGVACRSYFCPTHDCLSPDIKILIRKAARDWFDYGLMITEADLVQAFLDATWNIASSPLPTSPRWGERHEGLPIPDMDSGYYADIIRELMDLKRSWPYRPDPAIGLIHYFFNDRLYARVPVDYAAIGAKPSCYDRIFQELGSGFGSIHELREAEAIVADLLSRMSSTFAPRIFRSFSSIRASLADSSATT